MYLKNLSLIAFLLALIFNTSTAPAAPTHSGCDVPEAWHEWSVAGSQSIYLAHLPMFSSIHAYQIIIEVNLLRNGTSVNEIYFQDRKNNPRAD